MKLFCLLMYCKYFHSQILFVNKVKLSGEIKIVHIFTAIRNFDKQSVKGFKMIVNKFSVLHQWEIFKILIF